MEHWQMSTICGVLRSRNCGHQQVPGNGYRYTGGVVGLLTDANGALEGGNVRVSVHAEEAEGSWNYTGGVAGCVRFGALISDVTVAGNVTGGKVADYKETNTHSAVGGLVGYVDKASVTGGIAFGKVAMSPTILRLMTIAGTLSEASSGR